MCFSLHLTDEKASGYLYSFIIFSLISLIVNISITFLYYMIVRKVTKSKKLLKNTELNNRSCKLKKSVSIILFTNLICGFPISIIGIKNFSPNLNRHSFFLHFFFQGFFSIFGLFEINNNIYPWIIVFIIPLNSTLNPYIYSSNELFTIIQISKKHEDKEKENLIQKNLFEMKKSGILLFFFFVKNEFMNILFFKNKSY